MICILEEINKSRCISYFLTVYYYKAPFSENCSHCLTFEIKCIFLRIITGFVPEFILIHSQIPMNKTFLLEVLRIHNESRRT